MTGRFFVFFLFFFLQTLCCKRNTCTFFQGSNRALNLTLAFKKKEKGCANISKCPNAMPVFHLANSDCGSGQNRKISKGSKIGTPFWQFWKPQIVAVFESTLKRFLTPGSHELVRSVLSGMEDDIFLQACRADPTAPSYVPALWPEKKKRKKKYPSFSRLDWVPGLSPLSSLLSPLSFSPGTDPEQRNGGGGAFMGDHRCLYTKWQFSSSIIPCYHITRSYRQASISFLRFRR